MPYQSLVVQSLSDAFAIADALPEKQPALAHIKTFNDLLFEDLKESIANVHKADDIFVGGGSSPLGKEFCLTGEHILQMIRTYPQGVLWPITNASAPDEGNFAVPISALLMVPVSGVPGVLTIPYGLARLQAVEYWGDEWPAAFGKNAAFFLGMFCDDKGRWNCAPVIGWAVVDEFSSDAQIAALTIVHDVVESRAEKEGSDPDEAAKAFMRDFITNEVGCVLTAKPPRF